MRMIFRIYIRAHLIFQTKKCKLLPIVTAFSVSSANSIAEGKTSKTAMKIGTFDQFPSKNSSAERMCDPITISLTIGCLVLFVATIALFIKSM